MRYLVLALGLCLATTSNAQSLNLSAVVDDHILPGFQTLAKTADALAIAAQDNCTPTDPDLRRAYHDAFDAFILVSHLRFGPTEIDNRGFALAFWPDPRGSTPKTLGALIANADPIAESAETYKDVSVAARGFYALEFLLFAPQFLEVDNTVYRCTLIQTLTNEIATTSEAIHQDWAATYGSLLKTAGSNDTYRTETEAARQLFTALSTGLEFTSSARLGRPLGTFDRPRPRRAEVWRSGRSLRHVILSLQASRKLAAHLSSNDRDIDAAFDRALTTAADLDDPTFAGVSTPQSRLRIEGLQRTVDDIRTLLVQDLGPRLGVAAGFNSLDGD